MLHMREDSLLQILIQQGCCKKKYYRGGGIATHTYHAKYSVQQTLLHCGGSCMGLDREQKQKFKTVFILQST